MLDLSLAAISLAGGIGIWALRQEGRINGHDAIIKEHEKQAIERHDDVKNRLERIEAGIDRLAATSLLSSRR